MICCVDTSNIFFITWSMFVKDQLTKNGEDYVIKEDDLGLFYHMFIMKIMSYITVYKDIVFCFEGKSSTTWRKQVYPPYKANRKQAQDNPNYKFVPILLEKISEVLKMFHCKILKIPMCEGDDCIYQTCKYYSEKGEQVRIVSNDKDLSQIMNFFDGITQYNPVKQVDINKNDNILLEKTIIGDVSDNISGVPRIGKKTFEKMLIDKELYAKKMTPENQKIMENILQIVDLRKYPKEYQNSIKVELDKDWNVLDKDGIAKFFLDNGLKQCFDDWQRWSVEIESIEKETNNDSAEDEILKILGD